MNIDGVRDSWPENVVAASALINSLCDEVERLRSERDEANVLAEKFRGVLEGSNQNRKREREERDDARARIAELEAELAAAKRPTEDEYWEQLDARLATERKAAKDCISQLRAELAAARERIADTLASDIKTAHAAKLEEAGSVRYWQRQCARQVERYEELHDRWTAVQQSSERLARLWCAMNTGNPVITLSVTETGDCKIENDDTGEVLGEGPTLALAIDDIKEAKDAK